MARGVQLGTLVSRLRARLGDSTSVAIGQNFKATLVGALQAAQEFLYQDNIWPFLKVRALKNVGASQRYFDVPTNVAIESIIEVRHLWNSRWSNPLPRGITMQDYNLFNSDDSVAVDPIQKWDVLDTGSAAQIEVWPMCLTAVTNGLLFIGKRPLAAFSNDADTCDLDGELLIRWARADILEGRGAKNALKARADADRFYAKLKGNSSRHFPSESFAGGETPANASSQKPPIAVYNTQP